MTLVAAGGASGLAAAFNAPLGSIVFAVELMMPEISPRTLLPVTMAAGAGTFVARLFYGLQPTFLVQTVVAPELRVSGVLDLAAFRVLRPPARRHLLGDDPRVELDRSGCSTS